MMSFPAIRGVGTPLPCQPVIWSHFHASEQRITCRKKDAGLHYDLSKISKPNRDDFFLRHVMRD